MYQTLKTAAVCLVLTMLVCGCGSSAGQMPATRPAAAGVPTSGTPAAIPACAQATSAIERPSEFAPTLPLPPGTRITSQETRGGGRTVIKGVIPSDFPTAVKFFEQELPKAGFRLFEGESERGIEAESNYEGNGYQGRWVLRALPDCPALLMTMSSSRV